MRSSDQSKNPNQFSATLFIRGIKFIKHSYGALLRRSPELFGRKRTIRDGIKKAELVYVGEGRYRAEILVDGKKYAFILWIDSHNIATIVTMFQLDDISQN